MTQYYDTSKYYVYYIAGYGHSYCIKQDDAIMMAYEKYYTIPTTCSNRLTQ